MDLLDFHADKLYFDEPMEARVRDLIEAAAERYGDEFAEENLLLAFSLAPDNLSVLVALYRFYYYQYRLQDALDVANRVLIVCARRIGFPEDWKAVTLPHLGAGVLQSMSLVRFYFFGLKAAGFLYLRLGRRELGIAMLRKIADLDEHDRIGAKALLDVILEIPPQDDIYHSRAG